VAEAAIHETARRDTTAAKSGIPKTTAVNPATARAESGVAETTAASTTDVASTTCVAAPTAMATASVLSQRGASRKDQGGPNHNRYAQK
jgi:hypothetical protein